MRDESEGKETGDSVLASCAVQGQVCRENHEEKDQGREGVVAVQRLYDGRAESPEAGVPGLPDLACTCCRQQADMHLL